MNYVTAAFVGLEALIFIGALGIIVWLIFRRIRLKKLEDFEKRDN